MNNQLTPKQEERLFDDYDKSVLHVRNDKSFQYSPGDMLAFARLYTEASKAGMSGEVKSAEEILQEFFNENTGEKYSRSWFDVSLDAMREYAAQLTRWRPIDDNAKSGKLFVFSGWIKNRWIETNGWFRGGKLYTHDAIGYPERLTHYYESPEIPAPLPKPHP